MNYILYLKTNFYNNLNKILNRYLSLFRIIFIFCFLITSCQDEKLNQKEEINQDSIETEKKIKKQIDKCSNLKDSLNNVFDDVIYEKKIITNFEELQKIKNEYQLIDTIPEQKIKYRAFTTLNRKELRFIRINDTILIPSKISEDLRTYSVFPLIYCEASHLEKLIVVSNVYQAYACYENGILVRFAAANTGKESTPTYPGRYSLVWRQRLRISSLDSTWELPFTFNFHQYAGNAFHQFEMPGRPVSHSCVRQFMDDAEWLYKWGKRAKLDTNKRFITNSGTPVIMLGMFDYDRKRGGVWIDETSNKKFPIELKGNPLEIEEALIPISQIPKTSRGVLPNKKRYLEAESILRERGIIREKVNLIPSVDFNKQRREKKANKERSDKLKLEKEKNELDKLEQKVDDSQN